MREEFDCGKDVILSEEYNPHDVAALLKEFFRDLPDPVLTKDLYSAFVATRSKLYALSAYSLNNIVTNKLHGVEACMTHL